MSGTYKCDYPGCLKDNAEPIYTAALSTITKKRQTRQPKWRCLRHRKGLHRVSPTTGERVRAVGGLHRMRAEMREVRSGKIPDEE